MVPGRGFENGKRRKPIVSGGGILRGIRMPAGGIREIEANEKAPAQTGRGFAHQRISAEDQG
jgi:hypothetical protein